MMKNEANADGRWAKMKVLVACEESQTVCKAFRERGHEAYSCNIQEPSGGHPEWHIMGDVLESILGGQITTMDGQTHDVGSWDLLIAYPPCTYLSNAGANHLFRGHKLNIQRYYHGMCGKALFMAFFKCDIPRICIENPVPSRIFELPEKTQIIQPFWFGHPVQKKTCLWLKNLPLLEPTDIVEPTQACCDVGGWFNLGGKERQKKRSKTFPGIAAAMAEQWG